MSRYSRKESIFPTHMTLMCFIKKKFQSRWCKWYAIVTANTSKRHLVFGNRRSVCIHLRSREKWGKTCIFAV